jgi:menaquinone-dependent protoporphyrinogen oxidase
MRVLVTWGSNLGGTAGIAAIVADTLKARGIDVVAVPATEAPSPLVFDAVIVGGALYASRWPASVRHYVERNVRELSRIPTWMFSSGPLDDSAERTEIPAPRWLKGLIARTGAIEHRTFGGRLEATVKGFPAEAMARKSAGDWRNPERIRAWTNAIADALPTARPLAATEPAGRSPVRVAEYGLVGAAVAAAVLVFTTAFLPMWFALTLHAGAMPVVFAALAIRHQGADGARSPALVALAWIAITCVVDVAVIDHLLGARLTLSTSLVGLWLPLALSFASAWAAGAIAAMLPLPRPSTTPGNV